MCKINDKFEMGDSAKEFDTLGCSPDTIQKLCEWLNSYQDKIKELHIALYLFNNRELYDTLLFLADNGCHVTIYSIPLEGYDDIPAKLFNHKDNSYLGRCSKKTFAEAIYNDIQENNNENISLRIVPHIYLRSANVNPFSRGNMPYSLHCKTFYMLCNDGTAYAGITSSNLAVRDKQKFELSSIILLNQNESIVAADYFEGLYENSVLVKDFNSAGDYTHFYIKMRKTPMKARLQYIAPFYEDSASEFENRIITMVSKAKKRIIVCAQHISSYDYSYEEKYTAVNAGSGRIRKEGFLKKVLEKSNNGVETIFLSQTYADNEDSGNRVYRTPVNKKSFIEFINAVKQTPSKYYVNKHIHCKFIIIDDHVILTTCNFTPTQFIYLSNVNIPKFEKIPGFSYSGIHCENGVYYVETDEEFANKIVNYVNEIINHKDTINPFE